MRRKTEGIKEMMLNKKYEFANKQDVDIGSEEMGLIVLNAVDCILGRMNWMVGFTVKYVSGLIPFLADSALDNILADIRKHEDFFDLGMQSDKQQWMMLKRKIMQEIQRRKG